MAIDKYKSIRGKEVNISPFIYKAVEDNIIDCDIVITQEGKRLDHYSQDYYSDANNWWIISAASGIGWWLQVPPGTVLRIPVDLQQVIDLKNGLDV
jgi:hypothetical protein